MTVHHPFEISTHEFLNFVFEISTAMADFSFQRMMAQILYCYKDAEFLDWNRQKSVARCIYTEAKTFAFCA